MRSSTVDRRTEFVTPWTTAARGREPADVLAAAARQLARARGLDPDAVGRERAMATEVGLASLPPPASVDDLGALHQGLIGDRSARKADGAYYTPPALADALVEATLGPWLRQPHRDPIGTRIADPACGAGAFLVRALRSLRAAAPDASAAELARCVAGVDRDPLAAAVCRDALWIELGDPDLPPADVAGRIVLGDALVGVPAADLLAWPTDPRRRWEEGDDRAARDLWCALWFDSDPRLAVDVERRDALLAIATRLRPVHWELAFPDVRGFDVVVCNPPWDIGRVDARTFFERFDPGHRSRRKQDAVRVQRALCARDPAIAAAWEQTRAHARSHARFCRARFRLQPDRGDPNAYQRFVELGLDLLHDGGRLGMLVPAGLYADLGSRRLRDALLDDHRLERLRGFENRGRLFPGVDNRFKLAAIVVEKGGRTGSVDTGFMRIDARALGEAGTSVPVARIGRLSPDSRAFVEVDDPRALALLERMHDHGTTFGAAPWDITFRRELDLTLDSWRFAPAGAEAGGDLLPLWEGRMIGSFDFAEKGWVSGHGRAATWRQMPWSDKRIEPQYRVARAELTRVDPAPDRPKVGFLAVGSATNTRTMIATVLWRAPCGNSVPTLRCAPSPSGAPGEFGLCAVLNSLVYDWALRARMAGNNLNRFLLADTPLPAPGRLLAVEGLPAAVASLCWANRWFDDAWESLPTAERTRAAPTVDPDRRRRVRAALDAVVAAAFGLTRDDLAFVLRDTDLPVAEQTRRARDRSIDPKGLWRVDRDLPVDQRLTTLALAELASLDAALGRGTEFAAAAAELLERAASQTTPTAR